MKTKNKQELSAADKKLIAEYAAKFAVLRKSLKSLSDRKQEMHEKAEKAFEAWNSFRVELRGKAELVTDEEVSKLRKLFRVWKDLEAEKTLCDKISAAIVQQVVLPGEEVRLFNVEASAPKFVFETK